MSVLPNHRTKIVCTLGPSTDKPEVLEKLLRSGLDVARLNAAHSDFEVHRRRLHQVREIAASLGVPVAVLLDLPGPKHRLGKVPEPAVSLHKDEEVYLGKQGNPRALPLADPSLLKDLRSGDTVFLADGTVRLIVTRPGTTEVRCRVEFPGSVRSGSGLNLPTSKLSVRLPTADDRLGIEFACRERIDWLGISFVRTAEDMANVRRYLPKKGFIPRLVAKIEKREALTNLESIVAAADGVMVARGDLGVETPLESVPLAQKRIIAEAIHQAKPVITATQMLESMIESSTPTRAEVTDVANAVLDGTDAVMLSGETAIGSYPVQAVQVLDRVIGATEARYPFGSVLQRLSQVPWDSMEDALSLSVCRLSYDLKVAAIVVTANVAATAFRIARFRPHAPVIKLTLSHEQAQPFNLVWNVRPLVVPGFNWPVVRKHLMDAKVAKSGDRVVLISTDSKSIKHASDALQVLRV